MEDIGMSRRQLKTDDEYGFLRAFRDEILDLSAVHNVRVKFTLNVPVHGEGLMIHGEAEKRDPEGHWQTFCWVDRPYPSHSALRLHAGLYNAAIHLGVAIRDVERELRTQDRPAL